MKRTLAIIFVIFLASCAPMVNPVPTETMIPTATITPIPPTITNTPTSTPKPTKTPIPIIYVTLGSPFASDCGDGIPRIWSNDSFNGVFKQAFDGHHGHVDVHPPKGCNIGNVKGAFYAPATGVITKYIISGSGTEPHSYGYHLSIPKNTYIEGTLEALKFSGVEKPDINKVSNVMLHFGHVNIPVEGNVEKGQSIGELLPGPWNPSVKIGYQVTFTYAEKEYMFSPTLFKQDGVKWVCYPNSPYDCEPEPNDYAP
jgi:hypothetical protein